MTRDELIDSLDEDFNQLLLIELDPDDHHFDGEMMRNFLSDDLIMELQEGFYGIIEDMADSNLSDGPAIFIADEFANLIDDYCNDIAGELYTGIKKYLEPERLLAEYIDTVSFENDDFIKAFCDEELGEELRTQMLSVIEGTIEKFANNPLKLEIDDILFEDLQPFREEIDKMIDQFENIHNDLSV